MKAPSVKAMTTPSQSGRSLYLEEMTWIQIAAFLNEEGCNSSEFTTVLLPLLSRDRLNVKANIIKNTCFTYS